MGAMGKSAQFLLHTWLPDAMEGPTPVSALIHAATMVTAGVFMVARLSPLFDLAPAALASSLSSARRPPSSPPPSAWCRTTSSASSPIRPARSSATCSSASASAATALGIFHLFTHAFFKALLFLGAGSVITAMHHEQDMRAMGGLRKDDPLHLLDDDDRHAGADRRRHPVHLDRLRRLSSRRTRSSRRPTPRRASARLTPSSASSSPPALTSFYSWRLRVHDLLRRARRLGGDVAERAHATTRHDSTRIAP